MSLVYLLVKFFYVSLYLPFDSTVMDGLLTVSDSRITIYICIYIHIHIYIYIYIYETNVDSNNTQNKNTQTESAIDEMTVVKVNYYS